MILLTGFRGKGWQNGAPRRWGCPIRLPSWTGRAFFQLFQSTRFLDGSPQESLLLFAELENLEEIGAEHGQAGKKAAAQAVLELLQSTFRKSDIYSRLSENLFAVVAVGAGKEGTNHLLGRLRRNLEQWNGSRGQSYPLLLRMGAAPYDPRRRCLFTELLAQAARAIAEDKYEAARAKSRPISLARSRKRVKKKA